MDEKTYIRHTELPGGQRTLTAKSIASKNPALFRNENLTKTQEPNDLK
jgi:hypothetical protein